jgi:hypothetical protein
MVERTASTRAACAALARWCTRKATSAAEIKAASATRIGTSQLGRCGLRAGIAVGAAVRGRAGGLRRRLDVVGRRHCALRRLHELRRRQQGHDDCVHSVG